MSTKQSKAKQSCCCCCFSSLLFLRDFDTSMCHYKCENAKKKVISGLYSNSQEIKRTNINLILAPLLHHTYNSD